MSNRRRLPHLFRAYCAHFPDRTLEIDEWSPGDGWTRYRLVERIMPGYGVRTLSPYQRLADFVDALDLALMTLRMQREDHAAREVAS